MGRPWVGVREELLDHARFLIWTGRRHDMPKLTRRAGTTLWCALTRKQRRAWRAETS